MSNPSISEIRANSKARFGVITATTKRVLLRSRTLERQLYKMVLERVINKLQIDTGGFILNTPENRAIIRNTDFVGNFFQRTAANDIIKELNKGFKKLDALAFDKYQKFGNVRDLKSRLQTRTRQVLGLKPRGQQQGAFFSGMIKDTTQSGKVAGALNLALSQEGKVNDFKRIVRTAIKGNDDRLGVISNFQVMTMQSQSATDEYDRFIQNEYSKALQLNYAIYQGGEIESTREFCEERNGGVYTREEIASWNNLEWQGKKQAHNIFLDCGGYNCRHYYDWISYELAVQLRSNIGRSSFDAV